MEISKKVIIIILISLSQSITAQVDINKSIDYSSVDAFWKIVENVKNETVTEKDWDYLFSTPYYRFYEKWNQRKYIKKTIVMAFSTSTAFKRDSLIGLNDFYAHTLNHLLSVYANKDELEAFKNKLITEDLASACLKRVTEFLPSDLHPETIKPPPISFGILQPDGNASSTSIAIDLKLYFDIADPTGLMAHEIHHFFTKNYRREYKATERDSTNKIIHAISQLQLEGIADMIDKKSLLSSGGKGFPEILNETYRKSYSDPLPNLKKIDSLLIAISRDPFKSELNSIAIVNLLPIGGHPHGFYMAQTILEALGKDDLLKTIRNPFDFIRAYNRASEKLTGKATFSKESMNFLKKIEDTHSF